MVADWGQVTFQLRDLVTSMSGSDVRVLSQGGRFDVRRLHWLPLYRSRCWVRQAHFFCVSLYPWLVGSTEELLLVPDRFETPIRVIVHVSVTCFRQRNAEIAPFIQPIYSCL
jgi:hypothetical protein